MSTARFHVGDVFDVIATLPGDSVDLVASSPPFLALRSYLPADHPDKAKEIGSEPTPADYLDTLLDVVEACDRVLAPHGSLCFEIGDTYAGHDNRGSCPDPGKHEAKFQSVTTGAGWPLDKSLTGIPTLFAWSLAYGRNLLRPERTTGPWRIRNVIAWTRPNPAGGALGDKCRPATSYITVATKSRTRYWDMDAVRTVNNPERVGERSMQSPRDFANFENGNRGRPTGAPQNPAGAPLLDHWNIPTQPSKLAHFAMWPEEIARRLILLMCPEQVCVTCGEPRRRIVETSYIDSNGHPAPKGEWRSGVAEGMGAHSLKTDALTASSTTLGWTACSHDNYRRGVVLDPFGGTGTTGQVACQLGRDAILIDLDERNAELARKRISGYGVLKVTESDGQQRPPQGQAVLL